MGRVELSLQLLGQSGCRLQYGKTTIYMDPYLSNSVQELDSADLRRLIPIPLIPGEIKDAGWVLITHDHIDHCDPHTLPHIAKASPQCLFMGPSPVLKKYRDWNISNSRYRLAEETWVELGPGVRVKTLPAAHPKIERDAEGNLACVGYLFEVRGRQLYFAGDTSVTDNLVSILRASGHISAAILPVNEQNFFRDRRNIIGNMSIRESFLLAEEIGVDTVVPVHWDMFAANSVSIGEIEEVYRHMKPKFDLKIKPRKLVL